MLGFAVQKGRRAKATPPFILSIRERNQGSEGSKAFQLFQAFLANALSAKQLDAGAAVTKDAGGLIFFQDDTVTLGVDLNAILQVDV